MEIAIDHRTPPSAPAPRGAGSRSSRGSRSREEALHGVLAELGQRVGPITLARERALPVMAPFDQLLPEGLVRGRTMSCQGPAARSTAFGLVHPALAEGAWMAIVDVPTFGTDSAAEFGVPLERVVRIDTGADHTGRDPVTGSNWIEVMSAAVDGFDLVLTRVPAVLRADHRPAAIRTLRSRVQQRGAVVLVLGSTGVLGEDIELTTRQTVWDGLDDGAGHLRRRVVDVHATGRRLPGRRSCSIEMTGDGTRVVLERFADRPASDDRDPQAELLAEMADAIDDLDGRRLAG